MTRALDGLTKAVEESQRLQASHAGAQVTHSQAVDRRLVEVAVVQRQILERLITLSGSSAKAVKALDDSRKFLVEKETKDEITGEHIRLRWTTLVKWWPVIWKAGTVALLAVGAIKYVILEAIKYWRR